MNYLDNAATTLVKPRAVGEAVHRALTGAAGYARGGYAAAQRAGDLVYDCREQAAALFGLYDPSRVIFTQNATHALNIAIHALARPGMKVAVSGFEHNAVMRPLALHGIDPAVLHTPLWQPERMVQEVRRALDEIGRLLSAAGVPLILDASQSAGVLELDVSRCPCLAAVCMPGHKALYGPMGTGLLLALDDRLASRPLMAGGTGSLSESMNQPDFLPDAQESGTPNVPGIAGLAAGIRFVRSVGAANIAAHERKLVRELARALEANERLEVFSHPSQTGVLSVRVKGVPAEQAAAQLADAGIAVRAGLHCAPLAHRTAGTEETGTVRLSFSFYSTPGQAEQTAEAFKLVKKL